MATFNIKMKGNQDPDGKPRVYFTCHPDDFDAYFEAVSQDLLDAWDCAVYYTVDMNEEIAKKNLDSDLGRINLMVIPVTSRLLHEESRARRVDLEYAKEKNIPILPFMMEEGLDAEYALEENFGERQYLNSQSRDYTEISYKDKLKKHLESVLFSDETVRKIRAQFDGYIFLSYRKKDRHYANQLMQIIHSIPAYRSVAIWYDEFLPLGESFRKNISKAMKNSGLFALLVTPNLLESVKVNGKTQPNYVMAVEYPAAKSQGMEIIPFEMEDTSRFGLMRKYKNLPRCIDPHDKAELYEALMNVLPKLSRGMTDHSGRRYLLGLAYLNGIDVEVNVELALELLKSAAEEGFSPAINLLYDIYYNGKRVEVNYHEALKWAQRMVEINTLRFGKVSEQTIIWRNGVSLIYEKIGDFIQMKEVCQQIYQECLQAFGDNHRLTLAAMSNLATCYYNLNLPRQALELQEGVAEICRKLYGENDAEYITVMNNLAQSYSRLGQTEQALEIIERNYLQSKERFGEEHSGTRTAMHNLAGQYLARGEYDRALELCERLYAINCKLMGEEHPTSALSLNNMAYCHCMLGNFEKGKELFEKAYGPLYDARGESHPMVIELRRSLMHCEEKLGNYDEAWWHALRCYQILRDSRGENDPEAQRARAYLEELSKRRPVD